MKEIFWQLYLWSSGFILGAACGRAWSDHQRKKSKSAPKPLCSEITVQAEHDPETGHLIGYWDHRGVSRKTMAPTMPELVRKMTEELLEAENE